MPDVHFLANNEAWAYEVMGSGFKSFKKLVFFTIGWLFCSFKLTSFESWGMLGFEGQQVAVFAAAFNDLGLNFCPKSLNRFCVENNIYKDDNSMKLLKLSELLKLDFAIKGRFDVSNPEVLISMFNKQIPMVFKVTHPKRSSRPLWLNLRKISKESDEKTYTFSFWSPELIDGSVEVSIGQMQLVYDPEVEIYVLDKHKGPGDIHIKEQ